MLAFIVENAMTILFVVGIILVIATSIAFSLAKRENRADPKDELFSVIPAVSGNEACCATTAASAVSEEPAKSADENGCGCDHT